jgi:hypothetical protein
MQWVMLVTGNQENPQQGQATYKEIRGGEWKSYS